jgi:DNA-binding transcriptional MerR regulator
MDHTSRHSLGHRAPVVCRLAGISYRKLDYWDRTGIVSPSIASARGSGSQRLYSFTDTLLLLTVNRLLDTGMTLGIIRRAIETIRPLLDAEDYGALVFIHESGHKVEVARGPREILRMVSRSSGGFVFSVEALVDELTNALANLKAPALI